MTASEPDFFATQGRIGQAEGISLPVILTCRFSKRYVTWHYRTLAIVPLIFIVLVCVAFVEAVIVGSHPGHSSSLPGLLIFGVISLLILRGIAASFIQANLTASGPETPDPTLVIDEAGFIDHRKLAKAIRWQDIAQYRKLATKGGISGIRLYLRTPPERLPIAAEPPRFLAAIAELGRHPMLEIDIDLFGFPMSGHDLYQALVTLIEAHGGQQKSLFN